MVTQQVSSSPEKKEEQQQLSSLVAQQLGSFSRKETTAQHLSKTWDGYCRILTDSVSLVFLLSGETSRCWVCYLLGYQSSFCRRRQMQL